jgi:pilus assembly protein Flp/PilA
MAMNALLYRFCREDEGQDLIEYALLAGFISLAATTAITLIGGSLNTLYTTINTQVGSASS